MRREFSNSFVPFSEQQSWRKALVGKALGAGELTWAGMRAANSCRNIHYGFWKSSGVRKQCPCGGNAFVN